MSSPEVLIAGDPCTRVLCRSAHCLAHSRRRWGRRFLAQAEVGEQLPAVHRTDAVNPAEIGEVQPMGGVGQAAWRMAVEDGPRSMLPLVATSCWPDHPSVNPSSSDCCEVFKVCKLIRTFCVFCKAGGPQPCVASPALAGPSQRSSSGENTSRITVSSRPPRKKR